MRTELHFHLLPGVDDGPADDAEALALARAAVADGTGRVVTTPHVGLIDLSELPERVQRLRRLLAEGGVALEVQPGGELSPGDVGSLSEPELELIAHGPPGRRWVLVEAPLGPSGPDLLTVCAELWARGYQVLVGHPERAIPALVPAQLEELTGNGAMLQINASSLVARHGAQVGARALALASSGLPFVLASDAHSRSRPPLLSAGAEELSRAGVDADVVRFAVDCGPARLLAEGLPLGSARGRPRAVLTPPQA